MRRLVGLLVLAFVSLNGVGQELLPRAHPYLLPADPLADREHVIQPPRLFWEEAQPIEPSAENGRLSLNAGEAAIFRLSAPGHLRLQMEDAIDPPLLWLSRDGSLWEQASWTPGSREHEWFHVQNDSPIQLARLEASGPARGRLLVAELDPIDTPDPYQPLALPDLFAKVELVDQKGERSAAHRLGKSTSLALDLEGPIVIAIDSRPTEEAERSYRYSLGWALDEGPWQQLPVERPQLSTRYHAVDGVIMHGGMDRHFLTVPPGEHRLRIKTSVPLYFNVLEARENYFLDRNQPTPTTTELTRKVIEDPVTFAGMSLPELDVLSRTNHIEGAAEVALGHLEQAGAGREQDGEPDGAAPAVAGPRPLRRALAGDIERRQRFYRNLFPDPGSTPLVMNTAWFATTSPLELEAEEHYYLGERLLERLGRGLFVELGQGPLVYPLPSRSGPSVLRLAVARRSFPQEIELYVQYDDAAPLTFKVTDSVLSARFPAPEQVALPRHQANTKARLAPTLGGQFAKQREPGHHWDAATATVPLPADVAQVRIWSNDAVSVALQYRASKPYEVDESTYTGLLAQAPAVALVDRLHRALQHVPRLRLQDMSPFITPDRALENQWYPMLRYLHAAQAAYLDDFSARELESPPGDLDQRLASARSEAERENWIGVLQALGVWSYGSDPKAYSLAQKAFEELGEHYLAGRQRQAAAVFAVDRQARRLATEELLVEYAATQSWDSQVRLLAARFLREGDARLLDPLGEALYRSGDYLWASQLGLLIARQDATPAWLSEAFQAAGWPSTTISTTDRALLRGNLAARRGANEQARAAWLQAGRAGLEQINRMREAEIISRALSDPDGARRLAGIQRWIAWSMAPEQEYGWVSLGDRIERSAGFRTLFSEVTRKPLALAQASDSVPAELEVIGPALLRVQLRKVEPDAGDAGNIDWLAAELVDIEGNTQTRLAPLTSRSESLYLDAVNQETDVSTADNVLLEVPPGLHRVRLRPRHHDYLIQLWQWQPVNTWPALPPLTPLALKELLAESASKDDLRTTAEPEFVELRAGALEPLSLRPPMRLYTDDLVTLNATRFQDQLRSLSFPRQTVAPDTWPVGSHAVRVDNLDIAAGVPESSQAAHALAVALLWQLEQDPAPMDQVAARLAQLAEMHNDVEAIRQLADRVLENYDWEYISNSFESVGVRQLPLQNHMHSPFRRVREALLPDFPTSPLLLTGRTSQGVELFTPDPLVIEVRLEQHLLPYERQLPVELMMKVDNLEPRRIRLSADETVQRVHLDPGEHALLFWLSEPGQKQFVTVTINRAGDGSPLLEDRTRTYHIAAPDQPASFYVKGPTWVRVQEWMPDNSSTTYRYVEPGWQVLTLAGGTTEDRYYRLHALRQMPEPELLEQQAAKAELASPVQVQTPTPPEETAPPRPVAWHAEDRHTPGAGLGSWGAYLGFTDRIDGSEDDVLPTQGSSVMEAGLSYRFRLKDRALFSRSDLLLRQLDGGQNILGARQWLDLYPEGTDWRLGLFGEAYLQPEEVAGLEGNNYWAARLRASIERRYQLSPRLRHEPGISINQRWLSLDSVPNLALSELDPDVFSPYKRDHQRSLVLSDRLTWAPHLDQRFYLEGALVSNESLDPFDVDYLEMTTVARQLFGSVAGEAGLRWRHYFQDDDRSQSLDREQVFFGANLLRWGAGANALTLRAETHYDIDRDDFGWQLRIGFEANAGRLSPAIRPDELDFVPLRRAQQRDDVEVNRLDPVYP